MVKYDTVLIRYGELSTKGKNRKDFITRLFHNVKYALRDYPNLTYQKTHDRIYIKLTDEDTDEKNNCVHARGNNGAVKWQFDSVRRKNRK